MIEMSLTNTYFMLLSHGFRSNHRNHKKLSKIYSFRIFCLIESPLSEIFMANTFSQMHVQVVVAVQNRLSLISPEWKVELYRFITGCVQNRDIKLLAINGMPDHIHLLLRVKPHHNLSEAVQMFKANSSKWINDRGFVKGKFQWQEGFGAFTYKKSDCPMIINYINRQEEHHSTKDFLSEYRELLKQFEIDFDDRYIFKEVR
jgi:putative transposase